MFSCIADFLPDVFCMKVQGIEIIKMVLDKAEIGYGQVSLYYVFWWC